jgi:type IV pilus assembly protein PilM
MLGFVQTFFAPKPSPIGVDFGTDAIRMAQVLFDGNDHCLIAAACADVPMPIRKNVQARMEFFVATVRDLLVQGKFRGRQCVLGLPSAWTFVRHLRMAKMDDAALRKALPDEAVGKLPIDPGESLLRHIVAGEVYQDQEPKSEVILMAAKRANVDALLQAAARAKLDVTGMTVEPSAMVDCFGHVYRRPSDAQAMTCYLDIGASGTRVVIARAGKILFMRSVPIGGDALNAAVADALKVHPDDARILRQKLTHSQTEGSERGEARAVLAADAEDPMALVAKAAAPAQSKPIAATKPSSHEDKGISAHIEAAMQPPLDKVIDELRMCRRYYEATFPDAPLERIIFGGGESRNRFVCQYVAQAMGLSAQLGDPMARLSRAGTIGMESSIDRRHPQPAWSVALGLTMGPAKIAAQGPIPDHPAEHPQQHADEASAAAPAAVEAAVATADAPKEAA